MLLSEITNGIPAVSNILRSARFFMQDSPRAKWQRRVIEWEDLRNSAKQYVGFEAKDERFRTSEAYHAVVDELRVILRID